MEFAGHALTHAPALLVEMCHVGSGWRMLRRSSGDLSCRLAECRDIVDLVHQLTG